MNELIGTKVVLEGYGANAGTVEEGTLVEVHPREITVEVWDWMIEETVRHRYCRTHGLPLLDGKYTSDGKPVRDPQADGYRVNVRTLVALLQQQKR